MELIYSMRRKPLKYEPPLSDSVLDSEVVRPICTISIANIIAFSSPTELSDSDGDTWGGHVYVCDLDTPWDSHKVTSTTDPVTVLEWDSEGKQLLVGTTVGDVIVYAQKDYLLNEWTFLYNASFPGEHIIKSVFFHNGRRVVEVDVERDAPLTERIQVLRSPPTLKGFGGVALEGACVVTATGLLGALTQSNNQTDSQRTLTATECLKPSRDHITCASFAHKNGNLLLAGVCASGSAGVGVCVRVWACGVCVSAGGGAVGGGGAGRTPPVAARRLTLALQPLPTIYSDTLQHPISIAWCSREDTDSLLVSGSTLTMWKLTERSHPVHKLLYKGPVPGNTTPGGGTKPGTDCFNTLMWRASGTWMVERGYIASCRLSLGAPVSVLAAPQAIHLLARDSHKVLCSVPVVSGGANGVPVAGSPPKKMKYGSGVVPSAGVGAGVCGGGVGGGGSALACVELSWLGGVAVVIDVRSQLHVYKLTPATAVMSSSLNVLRAVSLLEYSMVTGCDCLDILLTLKPNVIEGAYERLTENFHRQPQPFQQYYYHSWLKLRIALCRMLSSMSSSTSWLSCVQTTLAASAACGAALRSDDHNPLPPPPPLPPHPTHTPVAMLATLLDDTHHDHDKGLLALEAKPELCTDGGALLALQALRRILQRVVHIALTVLAAVGNVPAHHQSHGYELWTDPQALSAVRKMVVVARACGRGGDSLHRPLARLAAAGVAAAKPDLIEECATVSSQSPGRVWDALPRCAVSAPHARAHPLYFEYGVEPEALRYVPEPPAYAQCDSTPALAMDSIRYMYLGGGLRPARWRQCSRCGTRALPAAHSARHPLQRAYDARFLPACRCGGKWTLFSNVDSVLK